MQVNFEQCMKTGQLVKCGAPFLIKGMHLNAPAPNFDVLEQLSQPLRVSVLWRKTLTTKQDEM
jgi:hypothetical protein